MLKIIFLFLVVSFLGCTTYSDDQYWMKFYINNQSSDSIEVQFSTDSTLDNVIICTPKKGGILFCKDYGSYNSGDGGLNNPIIKTLLFDITVKYHHKDTTYEYDISDFQNSEWSYNYSVDDIAGYSGGIYSHYYTYNAKELDSIRVFR